MINCDMKKGRRAEAHEITGKLSGLNEYDLKGFKKMKQKNVLETTKIPYIAILLTVLALISFLLKFIFSQVSIAEGKNFDDDRNTVYTTVHVDITTLPIAFETISKGKNTRFYIAGNGENVYILKLDTKQYEKIREAYENSGADSGFKYHIVGRTYSIFENLEKASQSAYNDDRGENIITSSNYKDYFGGAYIDGTDTPGQVIGAVFSILGCVFAAAAVLSAIDYVHAVAKLKQAVKGYGRERLEEQLNDPQTLAYPKAGTYLTRQYLISNSVDFKVIQYEDLLWIYLLNKRLNFISIGKYIMAATRDGKCQPIVYSKNQKVLEEIMAKIYQKNPAVRLGYTKENQASYRSYLKQNR